MRALDPEVLDTVWEAFSPLIPTPPDGHPLGCHRPRADDRACFGVMLTRLATGCSWEDAERLCGNVVSDTTVRARRDEWVTAGVFDQLVAEAVGAYDRIIGLSFEEVSVDGSLHKAPGGGEGTGPNPTDRGKLGWKWSLFSDANGIPVAWVAAGANRNDSILLGPTLDALAERGLLAEIETTWLDRGYDSTATRQRLAERGITDAIIAEKRKPGSPGAAPNQPMGMRWTVERANSWLSNYGGLRRNNDRKIPHRLAQIALAVTFLVTAKLIDWRNRWSPGPSPIR